MRDWLEREWQRRGGGALIFLPLALVFGALVWLRRLLYRLRVLPSWRSPVPVVIVGNITVGGTGKTPLVIAVVEMLLEGGHSPGVVARGYGRVPRREHDPRGVVRVYPDVATPEHFGDEPVLIARRSRVPVYVSPDRAAAARSLLQAHPEVDVIVSDDGLQHYALARDVEIAVVDAERGFGNGLLLPSGPLREPVRRLREVDAVVMHGKTENGATYDLLRKAMKNKSYVAPFSMRLGRERFTALASNQEIAPAEFALATRGRTVAAVAGIGNPERFFDHLARLGIAARRLAFPDHHTYRAADLKLPGVELIVMTEKDAVKCGAFADARMWAMRVDALVDPELDTFILESITARSAAMAEGRADKSMNPRDEPTN